MRNTPPKRKIDSRSRPKLGWSIGVLFAVIMLSNAKVSADPIDLFFLVSKPAVDYLDVIKTTQKELDEKFPSKYSYTLEFVSELGAVRNDASLAAAKADLIVTVGTAAADSAYGYRARTIGAFQTTAFQSKALQSKALQSKALQSKALQEKAGAPIVSLLITDSAFTALANEHFGSVSQAFAHQVSAISIDQPTSRSIRLAKLLLPNAKKVGVMLGHSSVNQQKALAERIGDLGMTSKFVTIGIKDNPITKIDPIMGDTDIFIPVPDSRLINITTAKWILHLSYRHKVPVIAFSSTYVKEGALAAIYTSPKNVAVQAAEWIADTDMLSPSGGQIFKPKYYSMHFNYSVAASLDLAIKDKQFYFEQLHVGNR